MYRVHNRKKPFPSPLSPGNTVLSNNPYETPEGDDRTEPDSPSTGQWLWSLAAAILGPLLFLVWCGLLLFGWDTPRPLVFHAIYGICLLVPAIAITAFALLGRTSDPQEGSARLGNAIGTLGFFILGMAFFAFYAAAMTLRL